jgi:hypothetical protein
VIVMTKLWQTALLACAAAVTHMQPGYAADVSASPDVKVRGEMQGLSDVDVAIGRGDTPQITSFGLKLFPQPLPGTAVGSDLGKSDRAAVRREFSFLNEADDGALVDVVAAVRNNYDYDNASEANETGAAVNNWTGMLDKDEEEEPAHALAPPQVKQAPRKAPGRSPSGMGSQIVP